MRSSVLASLVMLPLAFAIQTASAATSESLWQPSAQLKQSAFRRHGRARAGPRAAARYGGAAFVPQSRRRPRRVAGAAAPTGRLRRVRTEQFGHAAPRGSRRSTRRSAAMSAPTADGRRARIDVSPQGFEAMVFDTDGVWVIQPQSARDSAGAQCRRERRIHQRGAQRSGRTARRHSLRRAQRTSRHPYQRQAAQDQGRRNAEAADGCNPARLRHRRGSHVSST